MFLAKVAGHFQKIGFAQGDGFLAVRTGNFLSQIPLVKPEMHAASGAGHFQRFNELSHPAFL